MQTYQKISHSVKVSVTPSFVEEYRQYDQQEFIWIYQIRIENIGPHIIQLRRRYWKIRDSQGKVQTISGEGVVGEQPILQPGAHFEYTSAVPLASPSGFMEGTYTMIDQDSREFEVEIPPFSLDSPYQNQILN